MKKNALYVIFICLFSQAFAADLNGTWYTGSNNGTPSLSSTTSNSFIWGTDGTSATASTGSLWSYFPEMTIVNDGDAITLSFTVTPLDATATTQSIRFGLFNDGGVQVLNNLNGTNSDAGFTSTLGYFVKWNTGGTTGQLLARTGGKTNPCSDSSDVDNLTETASGPAVTLTQGTAYDMTFTLTRNSAAEYLVTSTINGAAISGTTATINATSFNTFFMLHPASGIDVFTFSNIQINYFPNQEFVNFNDYTILSYAGSQDVSGTAVIENGGNSLHLTGNVWKCIEYNYTVTENTVLEFDFQSDTQGEEHCIGLDNDLTLQSDNRFRLYGTQTSGTNLVDYDDYASYAPGVRHYTIPVGQYYTGSKLYLVFVNDHDVASPTGESVFSSVRIYESDAPVIPEEYITVDDFDYELNDPALMDHWIDGSSNLTGSSISQYLAFYMNVFFDNTQLPYYSEVQYIFDTIQDWDAPNRDLSFRYLGDPNVDEIYVRLSDNTSSSTLRIIDPAVTQTENWTEVRLRLDYFTGLDLTQITEIAFGIGPESPTGPPDASGVVGFDEIHIVEHECDTSLAHLDVNEDCTIDVGDVLVLAEHWLLQEQTITASAPDNNQLLLHYAFEDASGNTVSDSTGNGYSASIEPGSYDTAYAWQSGGIDGSGCIDFDGQFWIEMPQSAFVNIDSEITISFWHYADPDGWPQILTPFEFATSFSGSTDSLVWTQQGLQAVSTGWNHYAFVKNSVAGIIRIYENGALMAQTENAYGSMDEIDLSSCRIGVDADGQSNRYLGKMDDFRVYSYPLTQNEIVYLVGGDVYQIQQPLVPLQISADPQPDGQINLQDIALIASEWLSEL